MPASFVDALLQVGDPGSGHRPGLLAARGSPLRQAAGHLLQLGAALEHLLQLLHVLG